jgi:hypothetical protein
MFSTATAECIGIDRGCHAHWLDASALACLAGIGRVKASRALARALQGLPWRGHRLEVREEHGRGGRSGVRYLVAEHSLPLELRFQMRLDGPYNYRDAARRMIVDELERLAEEHGPRAAEIVLDSANGGDLRPIFLKTLKGLSRGGPDPQLNVAALKRWRRDFREINAMLEGGGESLLEIVAEARRARAAKRREVEQQQASDRRGRLAAAVAAGDLVTMGGGAGHAERVDPEKHVYRWAGKMLTITPRARDRLRRQAERLERLRIEEPEAPALPPIDQQTVEFDRESDRRQAMLQRARSAA